MEKKHNITFNNLFRPAPAVVRKNKALALKKKLISLGHFILLAVS